MKRREGQREEILGNRQHSHNSGSRVLEEEMWSCGTSFLFPFPSSCQEQVPMTGVYGRILELIVSISEETVELW